MPASTTPPPLQGPTAKEKKYDRQLRLWAASGQQALERTHIVLINNGAGVVGIETLKNLVLPGIESFTIFDQDVVKEEDLGVNFFLSEESLGRSRAGECCRYLKELNPEVKGHFESQSKFLKSDFIREVRMFEGRLVVLIAGAVQKSEDLKKVRNYALEHDIPLFYIKSAGFYSYITLQLPAQFPIVDTHPDPESTQDLRLLHPWSELSEFVSEKTRDLRDLDDHNHGHIPYLLILLHYLEEWKTLHDGRPPENYKEKTAFRELVRNGARVDNAEGGEENFDEAVGAVLKSLNPPSITSGLCEIFKVEECQQPRKDSANFWIIASALRIFHASHNALPLPGSVPDMKAQSADYIQLQNIYKAKARKDNVEVFNHVRSLEKELGRESAIDGKEIEAFCKGAAFVKLVKGKSLHVPQDPKAVISSSVAKYFIQQLENEESLIPIYLSFLAHNYIYEDSEQIVETQTMNSYLDTFLATLRSSGGDFDIDAAKERLAPAVAELVRAGGAELHNISAFTGGMVAQEVIKVITKQYIPIDNTCIFDGITSKTAVFKL